MRFKSSQKKEKRPTSISTSYLKSVHIHNSLYGTLSNAYILFGIIFLCLICIGEFYNYYHFFNDNNMPGSSNSLSSDTNNISKDKNTRISQSSLGIENNNNKNQDQILEDFSMERYLEYVQGVKPFNDEEVLYWINFLTNHTLENRENYGTNDFTSKETQKTKIYPVYENGDTSKQIRPKSLFQWYNEGRCEGANLYLPYLLKQYQTWSNADQTRGGITKGMTDRSLSTGKSRSGFASLLYQILNDKLYSTFLGNKLYMDSYAALLFNTLTYISTPNTEFVVHNGKDLPVMLKHEVNPIMAYASADAFTEILIPCPWYILPLSQEILIKNREEKIFFLLEKAPKRNEIGSKLIG